MGEEILKEITREHKFKYIFWHEKNSLRFVDHFETLPDSHGYECNLNLTYAVRDGIICHCGEVDENAIFPRKDYMDLELGILKAGQHQPFTWEGCIVKVSDKIAYLGRDIEDAYINNILTPEHREEAIEISRKYFDEGRINEINNTGIIHNSIIDLCRNSTLETGIGFSKNYLSFINEIKSFNYQKIYNSRQLLNYKDYARLVINTIYNFLIQYFDQNNLIKTLETDKHYYPLLMETFIEDWILKYSDMGRKENEHKFKNDVIYDLTRKQEYNEAVLDFISGMTDRFAIKVFEEIIAF